MRRRTCWCLSPSGSSPGREPAATRTSDGKGKGRQEDREARGSGGKSKGRQVQEAAGESDGPALTCPALEPLSSLFNAVCSI